MTAKVITVFNSKGGVGKTTVAMNLAGTLGRRGAKVLVVDMDRQGTSTRWVSQAPDEKEFPAQVTNLHQLGGKMHRELRNKLPDFDYVIVDCPPAIESPAPSSALLVSDLAIIPFSPSVPDMWAVDLVSSLIDQAMITNENLITRMLATQRIRSAIGDNVIAALRECTGQQLFETSIPQLAAFRECISLGGTVHDVPRSERAVKCMESLADEVVLLLNSEE